MFNVYASFRMTEGYSGSDLTSLAKDAALGPIRGKRKNTDVCMLWYQLLEIGMDGWMDAYPKSLEFWKLPSGSSSWLHGLSLCASDHCPSFASVTACLWALKPQVYGCCCRWLPSSPWLCVSWRAWLNRWKENFSKVISLIVISLSVSLRLVISFNDNPNIAG